ncbi:hypothetical protein HMI54_013348 [Coelomomyces lativittatus]|nr:hypothetical protein HMI54_013348 [Coelomomyces lativittatus]
MPNQGKLVSIELREKHSHQAQKWVQLYSRGIYKQRIDFWVGSLPHVFQSHPFISKYSVSSFHGAVLDLLEPWSYFHSLIPFLKLDSNLIVYVPNITQAVQCQQFIHHTHCPLVLDKCLEIIERPWEIKKVAVKWPEKIQNNEPMSFNSPTTLTSTKRIMTENSPSCHTNLKSDTVTFENEVDNLNNTCGTSNHTIHNEKNHPMSAKSELYPQPSNSSTFPSSLAMKDLNWVCRPSHMPTGHTAFLLKFKVVGN